MTTKAIYLDSAATTHVRPEKIKQAIYEHLNNLSANPGRAGHILANENARLLFQTRVKTATLFKCKNPLNVVFTSGITQSLNTLLKGYLNPGDTVLCSPLEHNSMMRPLRTLEKKGVKVKIMPTDTEGAINLSDVEALLSKKIKLVAINHVSNVTGLIQPIEKIGQLCKKYGITFLVDTAQSAGILPIDMERDGIDILAFTGHKGLLGPMGTGGFILNDTINPLSIAPLCEGGTGSNSEQEEQPEFMPDRFESGTPNMLGIAGLNAAIEHLLEIGVESVREHKQKSIDKLLIGLSSIQGITIYGHTSQNRYTTIVSFTIENCDSGEIATRLDSEYNIFCRAGLHCSPAAHKQLGTFPNGTIRLSVSYETTEEELEKTIEAISEIARGSRKNARKIA